MKRYLVVCLMQLVLLCSATAQKTSPENEGLRAARKLYWIDRFQGGVAKISKGGDFGLIDSGGRVLCPPKYDMIFDFEGPVARVTKNGAYGLINRQGEETHPVNMIDLTPFTEGIASYTAQNKQAFGLLNEEGNEVTDEKYSAITGFKEGWGVFVRDTVCGIIDKQGREKVLMTRSNYPDAEPGGLINTRSIQSMDPHSRRLLVFAGGRAVISRTIRGKQKFGFIDTSGKIIIPIQYDEVGDFKNGFVEVQLNGQWGIINASGDMLIKPQYTSIHPTIDGLFIASRQNKFGIVEQHNLVVVPFKYDHISYLFKNLFAVTDGKAMPRSMLGNIEGRPAGAVGVIDDKGALVVPIEWESIFRINDQFGQACVIRSRRSLPTGMPRSYLEEDCKVFDERGFIDSRTFFQGQTIIDRGTYMPPGIGHKRMGSGKDLGREPEEPLPFALKTQYGIAYVYLDRQGRQMLKDTFDFAQPFKDGVAIVAKWPAGRPEPGLPSLEELTYGATKARPKYGVIDTAGQVLVPFEYEEISFADEQVYDVVPAKKNGKWGVVSFENEVVVPFEYDYVFSTAAGIVVYKSRLAGLLDLQGAVLLPPRYRKVQPLDTGIYIFSLDGQSFYGDKHGETIKL